MRKCRPFLGKPLREQWLALLDQILRIHKREGLALLAIDPLANFMPGGSENDAAGLERAPQLFGFGAGSKTARGVDGHAPKNIKMQVHFGSPMLGILPQSPQDHARGSSGVEWRP